MKSLSEIFAIICIILSVNAIVGCVSTNSEENIKWNTPKPPIYKQIKYIETKDGLLLTKTNAVNLLDNVNNMENYILNLETMIREMKKYYNAE